MDRREFLLGSLASTTAFAAGKSMAGAAKPPAAKILFGACQSSIEAVTAMRDVGYDFWEWSAAHAFNPANDDSWWQRQKEAIAKRPLPLRSCSGFIPGRFRLTGPAADHSPALDYAETIVRRAADAGVKIVVFGSGGARNVPGDFSTGKWPDLEKGFSQFTEFCKALASRIKDVKGISVAIEPLRPNESNIINYVFQARRVCRDVASPHITPLADIFHMMMGGDDPAVLENAGNELTHVHIAEYGTRLFPGATAELTPRMEPFMRALASSGYSGGVSCECGWGKGDFTEKAETALKTMKGMIS